MAVQTATILKSYFNTGDTPTEVQFADLIDSSVNTGLLDETAHGALDHTGLTGIPAAYSLPTASTTILGGVKVDGTTVTITDGVISSSGSGMTNPMTTAGDIIYGGTAGAPTRLAKGTDGQVLTLASGLPSWGNASGGFDPLVAEYIVTGSPRTEVTFSDLDGNTDGGYVLVINFKNDSASTTELSLFYNTNTTRTNYYTQAITGQSTVISGFNANITLATEATPYAFVTSVVNIERRLDNRFFYDTSWTSGTTSTLKNYYAKCLCTSTDCDNITSLTVTGTISNSIAVGSVFRLYRRK